jgi:hypothetical protein
MILEIDSRRRDRNEYPLSSDFIVPFYDSVPAKNGSNSTDSVLNGVIYYSWNNSTDLQGTVQSGSTDALIIIDLNQTPTPPSLVSNFYNGLLITLYHQNGTINTRIITSYNPSALSLTLQLSASDVLPGDMYIIHSITSTSYLHVNSTDQNGNHVNTTDQAYRGYYVMDETLSYGRTIVGSIVSDYNASLQYLFFQTPFAYSLTDSYTLRNTPPLEKWVLSSSPYINQDPAEGPIGPVILLPDGASLQNDFYKGKYIYLPDFISPVSSSTSPILITPNGYFYIVAYKVNGGQRKAFVQYDPKRTPLPTIGTTINICSFAYDNFVPLNYIGSMVSLSTARCYEITLVELTLPNVSLISGSQIAFYPYVYVRLKNVTSPSLASDSTTYSNNPDGSSTLFIAPVTDIIQPSVSAFVKLGNGMKKVIKFKPNDSFHFSVILPDGRYFQPQNTDLLSPYPPYDNLQIHAVFDIKPL